MKCKATVFELSLPVLILLFLSLLTVFATEAVAPLTVRAFDEYSALTAEWQEELDALEPGEDDERAEQLEKSINRGLSRMEILGGKQGVYVISMSIILLFYTAASVYIQLSGAALRTLAAALTLLMGIGTTYQFLFYLSAQYIIMLLLSIGLAVGGYFVWRRVQDVPDRLFYITVGVIGGLLLANLLFGSTFNGAKLWIVVAGFSIQPGELVKLLLVALGGLSYRSTRRSYIYCATAIISCGVLLLLRDLGDATVIFATFLLMSYMLFDSRVVSLGIAGGAVAGLCCAVAALPYARSRIAAFGHAMDSAGFDQQRNAIKGIIFGGFGGLGIENSEYVTGKFAADSDTALAGVMAVFGVVMFCLVIFAYVLLVLQPAFNRSVHTSAHLVLCQVSVLLTAQVLLNFCGTVDLLPFTGIVAPYISSGGSAMLAFGGMSGLCAASLHPHIKNSEVEEK